MIHLIITLTLSIFIYAIPVNLHAETSVEHFYTHIFKSISTHDEFIYGLIDHDVFRVNRFSGVSESMSPLPPIPQPEWGDRGFQGILAAPDGIIWLWSENSLFSNDGSGWFIYETISPEEFITCIVVKGNEIWLLSWEYSSGLLNHLYRYSRFDGSSWETLYTFISYPAYNNSVYHEKTNSFLSETDEGGVESISLAETDTLVSVTPVRISGYSKFTIDNTGIIWLSGSSNDGNLTSLNDGVYTVHEAGPHSASFLYADRENRIWAITSSGLQVYENGTTRDVNIEGFISITEDDDENIWFGTNDGLIRYDGTSFVEILNSNLPKGWSNSINDVAIDDNGSIWCVDNSYMYIYDFSSWDSYEIPEHLLTYAIEIDHNGTVWVGTSKGLYRYDETGWQKFGPETFGILADNVTDLYVDDNNALWFVIYSVGTSGYIGFYKNETCTLFERTWAAQEIDITGDPNGGILAGIGGVARFSETSGPEWIPGAPGDIRYLDMGQDGTLWVYDRDNLELSSYSEGTPWRDHVFLPEFSVSTLTVDHDGLVWLGQYEGGCLSYDGEKLSEYTIENGLLISSYVTAITVDGDNNKWISGEGGLTKLVSDDIIPEIKIHDISPFRISSIVPNPFNTSTTITFNVAEPKHVYIAIYNCIGQRIRNLITAEYKETGQYTVVWDGRDDAGNSVSSGVYLCRFWSNMLPSSAMPHYYSDTSKKMLLLR